MSFKDYIKDKGIFLGVNCILDLALVTFLIFVGFRAEYILLIGAVWILPLVIFIILEYLKRRDYYNEVIRSLDNLDKKYLLSEVIEEPNFIDGKLLYNILKVTDRDMNENVKRYRTQQQEYRDYIEAWVHEIKTPISSSKLTIDNHKNDITKSIMDELNKVEEYVEQVLYYSRSNDANKDYIVKEFSLSKVVKNVVSKNSRDFIQRRIKLNLEAVDEVVFSDIKWAEFIVNQILTNAIKYCNNENPEIKIYSSKKENNIILSIIDNGIGIPEKDLRRIFDKGFTGENGRVYGKSTGMGLYICNKLADKLGMGIKISSEINKGTKVDIIFPKSKLILLEE